MKTVYKNSLLALALMAFAGCSTAPESNDINAEDDYYETSQPNGYVDTDEVINDYYESLYKNENAYDIDRAPASVDREAVWPMPMTSQFYKNKESINMYSDYGPMWAIETTSMDSSFAPQTLYIPNLEEQELTPYSAYHSSLNKVSTPSTVRKVQKALNDFGHSIAVDGIIGTQTRNALSHFQQNNNIVANGQLNSKTMKALGVDIDFSERSPASIEEQESAETF